LLAAGITMSGATVTFEGVQGLSTTTTADDTVTFTVTFGALVAGTFPDGTYTVKDASSNTANDIYLSGSNLVVGIGGATVTYTSVTTGVTAIVALLGDNGLADGDEFVVLSGVVTAITVATHSGNRTIALGAYAGTLSIAGSDDETTTVTGTGAVTVTVTDGDVNVSGLAATAIISVDGDATITAGARNVTVIDGEVEIISAGAVTISGGEVTLPLTMLTFTVTDAAYAELSANGTDGEASVNLSGANAYSGTLTIAAGGVVTLGLPTASGAGLSNENVWLSMTSGGDDDVATVTLSAAAGGTAFTEIKVTFL